MSDYGQIFGARTSYGTLFDDLTTFFNEGGTHATVARVVGASATSGNLSLHDGAAINTIEFIATSPGAWSANVSVAIVASAITGQYLVQVFYGGVQVEQWGPFADVPTAVTRISASSLYVDAVNLNSTSTGATANPAVTAATALTAGADNRASITSTNYLAALNSIGPSYGSGYCAIPGQDASVVGSGLIAHAVANNRIAHLSPTQGMSSSTVTAAAATFRGATGSEYAGYFWPWVAIPDGSGGSRIIPPDGFVAGVRSRTVAAAGGPWQPPAGANGVARYVIGLDPASGVVTDAIGDSLNDNHVNVIRPRAGIRLYGWRSLSADTVNYELLTARAIFNQVVFAASQALEQYVFDTIDANGQLFSRMANTIRGVLAPYIAAGALYPGPAASNGQPSDPGYLLDTGSSVNTSGTLAANEAAIAVYLRPAPAAELIPVTVTKVAVGNAF
jgi:hypothetical protein